ncbi:MAG: hypothetical protein ABL959_26000, partial [Pyrinomonadaceae bacterium]
MFDRIRDSLLSLSAPVECHICSGEVTSTNDGIACSDCWEATTIFSGSEMLCHKCGAFFGPKAAPVEISCHQCDDHHYASARALGIYEKALAATILRLKREPVMPRRVTLEFKTLIRNGRFADIDLIVPIPLSKQRMLERGFNQAEVLAKLVGTELGVSIDSHSLTRTVHTPAIRSHLSSIMSPTFTFGTNPT